MLTKARAERWLSAPAAQSFSLRQSFASSASRSYRNSRKSHQIPRARSTREQSPTVAQTLAPKSRFSRKKPASICVTSPASGPLLKSTHKFKQNKDLFPSIRLAKLAFKPLK
jgi:hypothetical protein